jgi:D-glycero-alpha-D-manno-heptose 1-phosphate guanylyltransferase
MEVIVLAGGMGTRLRQIVNNVPKPMAPVNGEPFLKYILDWISQYNVSSIILSVGYKGDIIENYVGSLYNNIPISYAVETTPLGTGGGIALAMAIASTKHVVVINGDTYFPVNLNAFYEQHMLYKGKITLALKRMENFDRYGTVDLNEHTVNSFNEKQYCNKGLINGGIYTVDKQIFSENKLPEVFSFESEVLEKLSGTDQIKGVVFDEAFIDIGIPEDYKKACDFL